MSHHEAFKALGPIEWPTIDHDDLAAFFKSTFGAGQPIIDSIPLPTAVTQAQRVGRARSHTDLSALSAVSNWSLTASTSGSAPAGDAAAAAALLKEWKEVKINPRDNPLAINVYKLGAKDGKGAWFARRSVHEGITFAKFRLGLEREFAEALKASQARKGGPGTGNVRGIGAERRVEDKTVDGSGRCEVYQLSAQFPGPTTPRDFVTLLLSSSAPADEEGGKQARGRGRKKGSGPRQFMVVSKPCVHPDCPTRSGFIRGQYESVEVIREIPIEKPLRRTRSSIDLRREEARPDREMDADVTREATLRSAKKVAEEAERKGHRGKAISVSFDARSEVGGRGGGSARDGDDEDDDDKMETAIEWLMVTRSDPGGSVPRFMGEKGTPAGIVSDAGRLLDWLASKDPRDFETTGEESKRVQKEAVATEGPHRKDEGGSGAGSRRPQAPTGNVAPDAEARAPDAALSPSGFYGIIANALGVAGSVVASRMPSNPFTGSARATDSEPDLDDDDSDSDVSSYASAMESAPAQDAVTTASTDGLTPPEVASMHSTRSDESKTPSSTTQPQHERDLKKLQERRRKVHEKIAKAQERSLGRKNDDREKDAQALQKLREKHERELAKQEEKYQRELRKLEQKKLNKERKAEERRRKQVVREEKTNKTHEHKRDTTERDVALKQIDVLKDQIGELQSQNTMLVAKLGKNGLLKEEDFKRNSKGEKVVALRN